MALLRHRLPELMDDPGIDPAAHHHALRGLARINALTAVDRAIWRRIQLQAQRDPPPLRFLDVATGAGDLIIRLARRAALASINIQWHAVDISPVALHSASRAAEQAGIQLHTHRLDIHSSLLPSGFDIAHCGLFLHHFDPPQVKLILRRMADAARTVIVQDLRRTRLGLAMAKVVPPLLTRSPIVHTDAVLSVRAAFTIEELRTIADSAGLTGASIMPLWPQRILMTWERAA